MTIFLKSPFPSQVELFIISGQDSEYKEEGFVFLKGGGGGGGGNSFYLLSNVLSKSMLQTEQLHRIEVLEMVISDKM